MTYARQRDDLIRMHMEIPYRRIISGRVAYTQLKNWVEVIKEDDHGNVYTPVGTFDSSDLEFKDAA